ncbi:MAG: hypothetical protein LBV68_03535 [Spirochaetaceae bacterium]|nr:hypothetical protein [Spirochaetaceae bacterium]
MKKVFLLVMDKDKTASLEKLRELGIVHIEKKEVSSGHLSALLERKSKLEVAGLVIGSFAPKDKKAASASAQNKIPADIPEYILGLSEKRKAAQEALVANTKEIVRIEKWGDFAPSEFKEITEKALPLYPYELSEKKYNKLKNERLIVLKKEKGTVFCVSLDRLSEEESPFSLPEYSLSELERENDVLRAEILSVNNELSQTAHLLAHLESEKIKNEEEIEFEMTKSGMEKMEEAPDALAVSLITGFCPAPEVGLLKRAAAENAWALYANDPRPSENPPTLTKNNAFVRIIKPLFDFLGTVPGYKEYDIAPSFLIFFCLFFAMIFGDAAYGTIIFVICSIIGLSIRKKTGKVPDAIKLFGLLALCTITWGAVNGSWFAIPQDNLPAFLRSLVIPAFNSDIKVGLVPDFIKTLFRLPDDFKPSNPSQWNIQLLCFTIAIIQLIYSHIKNIKKLIPSAVVISQIGWLVMMIGLYFLVLQMLLKIPMPALNKSGDMLSFIPVWFIGSGIFLYFIFANQTGGNVLANVGKSFANFLPTFLNAVSSFADIISYIRLFAVGLAGSSIAQSFNAMSGIGAGGDAGQDILAVILKTFAAILILVFGHGLNMMMNALSVIVHGVRLNLLEYAGNHLGMEWSGYSYKPFMAKQKGKK